MSQLQNNEQRNNRIGGLAGTLLFHGLLLLGMLLLVYTTPIPPFPETGGGQGSGLEVNLGYSDQGTGEFQPAELSMPEFKESAKPSTTVTVVDKTIKSNTAGEDLLTDEKGEDANINTEAAGKVKKVVKEPVPVMPAPITKALYKKSKTGGSQGITGKPGDQGKPDGVANSKIYTGSGQGNGTGNGTGQGNGSGNGIGNGKGDGVGNGISFQLGGRRNLSLPKPTYNSAEQGRVVVKIYVNREGKVTRVSAGAKGTTTTDQQLWKQAEAAALRAVFASSPDAAADEQTGTITYNFVKTR